MSSTEEYINININEMSYRINSSEEVIRKMEAVADDKYIKFKNGIQICKSFFNENKKVQPVKRHKLSYQNDKWNVEDFNEKSLKFKHSKYDDNEVGKTTCSILILLESPHEKEYSYENGDLFPIAPAQGRTGAMINRNIVQIMNEILAIEKIDTKEIFEIIIVNPIPYQTSLHYFHRQAIKGGFKILRDNVWRTLWENEIEFKKIYLL